MSLVADYASSSDDEGSSGPAVGGQKKTTLLPMVLDAAPAVTFQVRSERASHLMLLVSVCPSFCLPGVGGHRFLLVAKHLS